MATEESKIEELRVEDITWPARILVLGADPRSLVHIVVRLGSTCKMQGVLMRPIRRSHSRLDKCFARLFVHDTYKPDLIEKMISLIEKQAPPVPWLVVTDNCFITESQSIDRHARLLKLGHQNGISFIHSISLDDCPPEQFQSTCELFDHIIVTGTNDADWRKMLFDGCLKHTIETDKHFQLIMDLAAEKNLLIVHDRQSGRAFFIHDDDPNLDKMTRGRLLDPLNYQRHYYV